jgi:transcriptional regulator with XRE-family HTH domain
MQGSLAHKLRVLRAERGLTLREAASLTGVAKETISDIERGLRHPHDPTLAKIAQGYGVPVGDLLGEPVPAGKAPAPQHEAGRPEEEAAVRDLEVPYMDRPEVRDWLIRSGHKSDAEFQEYLEHLDLGLDAEGRPRGLERAITELREQRDRLTEDLRRRSTQTALFPPRQELPTKEERIKEALRPAHEAFKLRGEVRFKYLSREADIINYGRRLHAEGVTQDHLVYAHKAGLERRLDEMEKAVLAEAGAA